MKSDKIYNIYSYIKLCVGGRKMVVDGLIARYAKKTRFNINPDIIEAFHYIDDEPFYVSPQFEEVTVKEAGAKLNAKIILISAPGATGKSALAKYISYKIGAIYLELPKIKLGSNTFLGTILKAIGVEQYSKFFESMKKTESVLVVDALDEAEIVSGRQMLGEFIKDMNENIGDCDPACVFLLARTETAQFVASYCSIAGIPLRHYEIGNFSESQAEEFVIKKGKLNTPAEIDCVKQYFESLKSIAVGQDSSSFIGYAPVLEAISEHIKGATNHKALLNDLCITDNNIDIIISILKALLDRERKKVVKALQDRCKEKAPTFDKWECIYNEKEQLYRLVSYIIFNDTSYSEYPIEEMPPNVVDDYQEIIALFITQHPFIRDAVSKDEAFSSAKKFAGPAFRDYALANLITIEDYSDYADMYFEESEDESHFPSQLFFEFYRKASSDRIQSKHISLLYESYRAKLTAYETPYLYCTESSNDESEYVVFFGVIGNKGENRSDIVLNMNTSCGSISMSHFVHVFLNTPKLKVIVGGSVGNARISDSTIICKQIEFSSAEITIESYKPYECMLVSENDATGLVNAVEIFGDGNISIDFPNIKHYHKLYQFVFEFESDGKIDRKKVIHAMRNILIEFRTHKKDTLAKDIERINFVVVGNNPIKKAALDFLIAYGVIYTAEHLYKINLEKMQELGINYFALLQANTDSMTKAYEEFVKYYSEEND